LTFGQALPHTGVRQPKLFIFHASSVAPAPIFGAIAEHLVPGSHEAADGGWLVNFLELPV
jgi:hypothetical protein